MPLSNKASHRCGKKRQLSGVDRWCDLGYGHGGLHHAQTLTGVDRWWTVGLPGEFATLADLQAELERRRRAEEPSEQGGLLSSPPSTDGSHE